MTRIRRWPGGTGVGEGADGIGADIRRWPAVEKFSDCTKKRTTILAVGVSVRTWAGFGARGRATGGGRGWCWVAAAYVSAGSMLAKFFITISHCPWRDFISLSNGDKETKQRKRLSTICIKCPQRADHCFWFPRRTVLAKPRALETLLLANPYIPTLRHQCSRARSGHRQTGTASPLFKVAEAIRCVVISDAFVRA